MKIHLRRHRASLIVVSCLLYIIFIILQPSEISASELVYTIQVSSVKDVDGAIKEYNFLIDKLNQADLSYLRVEKISQYYSVRLGKFADRKDAAKIHQSVERYHPSALVMKAYIKDKRIVKLFHRVSAEKENNIPDGGVSIPKPGIPEAISAEDQNKTEEPDTGNQKKGDKYIKDGRLISASEAYWDAIREDPDNPVLISKLANALKNLGMLDQAIIQMKKAADMSSDNNTTFRVELGKLYLTAGRSGEAKEQFLSAIKMNPGSAEIHYYLGVVYMRETDYDMAWFAVKTSQSLGYESQDLISILSILSEEPHAIPSKETKNSMYIRHIVVDTHEEAEAVLNQHLEADLFNKITDQESIEQGTVSKVFIGQINSSKIHPKIAMALRNQEVFAEPVIVETDFGFHIVQRIMPLDPYFEQ